MASERIMNDDDSPGSGADSRDYSRISCFVRAMYRKMSHPDEPQLCPEGSATGDKLLRDRFTAGAAALPESVVSFLLNMDSKLDQILARFNKDALSTYFQRQMVVLDLSASGLLVQASDLLPEEYLELVISLGEFPSVLVSGVARVIRQGRELPGVGATFALQFTRLRESEREQIVRYVFKENRQRIRTEKFK